MICSESKLDAEVKFISTILCNISFTLNTVQRGITNKIIHFNKIKQAALQKGLVYLSISRLDGISERFSQTVLSGYFSANVGVVFSILTSICEDVSPPHRFISLNG